MKPRRLLSVDQKKASIGSHRSPAAAKPGTAVGLVDLALVTVLALATLGVYYPVGGHPFIEYDDHLYVTNNAHIKEGLSWATFTWAWTSTEASNWHPITWLSHAADYELYGLNASGHHWTSLLIHIVNVVLLFLLLRRITGARWRSLFVAALFALHPLNVESVAWVAERKNVLSTTFFLLAIGAYGWYSRKPGVRRYVLLVILFALGLAAKPMVISLPFVLLLLDFWPLRRIEGWTKPGGAFPVVQASIARLVLEKLPLGALSIGSAIITIVAQQSSIVPAELLPLDVRLRTSLYAYSVYVWKMLWPMHLALIYPHPGRTLGIGRLLLGALLIIAASAIAWIQRCDRPYLAFGWLWYLGTAVPIIGIMQVGVQVIADRYAYVPLLGLFVIVSWTLLPADEDLAPPRTARFALAALVLIGLAFLTWRQVATWQSTIDVWTHALQVTENNSMAENFLANALISSGRYPEGMGHLRKYAQLEPLDPRAHARVGADFQDHGELPEAIREYEAAIHASAVMNQFGSPGLAPPDLAVTYINLGLAYAELGNEANAHQNIKMAFDTDAKVMEQMITGLTQNLAMHPVAQGYIRLGLLLAYAGQPSQAQQALARARQLDPSVAIPPVFAK